MRVTLRNCALPPPNKKSVCLYHLWQICNSFLLKAKIILIITVACIITEGKGLTYLIKAFFSFVK
jgi:hypothetical protein